MHNYTYFLLRPVLKFISTLSVGLLILLPNTAFSQERESGQEREFSNGQILKGRFLEFWEMHGGERTFGPPISGVFNEISDIDGKEYPVQYFDYAEFEYHKDNDAPYDVLLTPIGSLLYGELPPGANDESRSASGRPIDETGKWLSDTFVKFWDNNGGRDVFGLPVSNEIIVRSDREGIEESQQYFERTVLVYHRSGPFEQEISVQKLGRQRWIAKYGEWWDKINSTPVEFLTSLFADNLGLRVIGVPAFTAALAVGFDTIISRKKGRRKIPEPFLAFALNMPILALSVDLTILLEEQQKASPVALVIMFHFAFLVFILGFMKLARDSWADVEDLPKGDQITAADSQRGRAATRTTWLWTWVAVIVGLLSLVVAFWAATVA